MIAENYMNLKSHNIMYREQFLYNPYVHSRWTLFIVEKGSFSYRIDSVAVTAGKGELAFFPPGRTIVREIAEPLHFHFVQFDWQLPLVGKVEDIPEFLPSLKLPLEDKELFARTLDLVHELSRQHPIHNYRLIEHFVNHLWLTAFLEQRTAMFAQSRVRDKLMDKVKQTLDESLARPLLLKELAQSIRLSPVQLTRRFRAAFGMSPIDYLTRLRLERVKSLLEETEYTVDHIAQLCGYGNGYYLNRLFADKLKLTPSQYRKMHRF